MRIFHFLRRSVLVLSISAIATQAAPGASAPASSVYALRTIYAQQLVNEVVKNQKGVLDVIFHVTPPNERQNYAIAAFTEKELGAKSGTDDIDVATTGRPVVEVQKDGVRIGVLLPLKDMAGTTIGTLGVVYTYKAGEPENSFLLRSESIRDNLARQIPAREGLFVNAVQR